VASGSAFSNVLKAKEDLQKSSEQLEQEKRSVISQRVPPLQIDGKSKEDLVEKVDVLMVRSIDCVQHRFVSYYCQGKTIAQFTSSIARRYL
jgi:hypothetical protein